MNQYARLLTFARPYLSLMIISVLCMVVHAGTTAGIAYLIKPAIDDVFVKNSSDITIQDLEDWKLLLALVQGRTPGLAAELLIDDMDPEDLAVLRRLPDEYRLSSRLKMAFVAALNRTKNNPNLYPEIAGRMRLSEESPVADRLDRLAVDGVMLRDANGSWRIKPGELSIPEREAVVWFNLAVLREVYPTVLTKSSEKDYGMLYLIPVLLVLAYLIKGLGDYGQTFFMGTVGNRAVTDIRDVLYRHIQTMSLTFFVRHATGLLMSRIANDVTVLRRSVSESLKKVAESVFMVIGLAAVAFYQNWRMAAACFVVAPLLSLIIVRLGRKSKKYSRKAQEQLGRLSTFLDETISGDQTVKAFCMQEYEKGRFDGECERLLRLNMKNVKIAVLASPVMDVCGGLIAAIIIYAGGYQVIQGTMTAGAFFSFSAAVVMLYRPVKAFSRENIKIQRGMAAAARVFSVLDIVPDISDSPDAVPLPPLGRSIGFHSVSFRYEDAEVLRDVSFSVERGQAVAIVGPSGAGKTTIANLLLRFYDVNGGGICIDGVDIRRVTQQSLRAQIAFVSQDTVLFNDTIRNNIAYGNPDVSDDDIVRAARVAYAHEFIERMPHGYQTVVGEKGLQVSGGQRQRIAIARALVKNAPILVLDEATSALDAQAEQQVQQALDNLMQGRTTIMIAHRLATVRNADLILVLSDGRIVERGTHAELMQQQGMYSSLIAIQGAYGNTP